MSQAVKLNPEGILSGLKTQVFALAFNHQAATTSHQQCCNGRLVAFLKL